MVIHDFFRELPHQLYDHQGFNMMVTSILVILNVLLAVSVGLVAYGLSKLRHARYIVHHQRMLTEKMRVSNAALEQKVSLLKAELKRAVTQLDQESEQRRLLAEQLKNQATTDSVTGLPNRRTGMALLVSQMQRSERYQWPLTIWSINIDNLKQVKERYGHDCVDQMVKELSRIIQSNIRISETVFRMGEDELMVILPQCSIEEATAITDRIDIACQLDEQLSHYEWQPVISHGLAEYQPGCRIRLTEFVQQALYARRRNLLAQI